GRYIVSELDSKLIARAKFQVITPSKAIAHYLQVPHLSLESLAQNIVRRRGLGVAGALSSRRLLQDAVRKVIKTRDIAGTARAYLTTVKDLLGSGIDLHRLQTTPDLRIQELARLTLAYQERLRKNRWIDGAELYWQGALGAQYQKYYTFYGYFAPSQAELTLINAIAGAKSIFVLPLDELYPKNLQAASWLQSKGWERSTPEAPTNTARKLQLQQCFKQKSNLSPATRLRTFSDLEAEVRGTLAQVKVLQSQGVALQKMVLVAREEQLYGETIIDVAWEYNLPVQIAYEIPLEQTRLGAWFKLLLEVIRDNFPFEATAKLLSHPLAARMSPEQWRSARESHPQGLAAWQQLGIDLSLIDCATSYTRSAWSDHLLAILTDWDVLENVRVWAREVVAYYRLQSGLKELSPTPSSSAPPLPRQVLISEINELLALLTVPVQPGRGGIELHCPTALFGTNYAHVFVFGAVEGILPQAIADNPLLDFHSRQQLVNRGFNISTAKDLALRETWDFYCMLNVPKESLTFSYPQLIDRSPSLPSPYLSRLGLKPSPIDNLLPLASIEEARRLYLRQPDLLTANHTLAITSITHSFQVENNRESARAPDQYDGVIGIGIDPQQKIFSASQLIQLGQCPFKWFSARLLKLQELPEAEADLGAAVRGNLYHRCLELALREVKTAEDLAQFNRQQLEGAFSAAERELKLSQLPGWSAQRQEHLELLALNLAKAEFLPTGREVLATETDFQMQWHGLKVRGQVDRIDRSDRGLTVIDYKTSSTTPPGVKDAAGKANLDLQLALYQDAIAEQYRNEPIDAAAYYSLTKQKTIGRPQKKTDELAAFAQRVKVHLQQGYYPVAPDRDRQACRYCNYDLVCRQGDRLSRKPISFQDVVE
ncbi:MAG: PD-(D/E)XK nuclease family protein, partial [Cyanobacteria bacterium J06623_7]